MNYIHMYLDNFWCFYMLSIVFGLLDIYLFDVLKFSGYIKCKCLSYGFVYFVFIPVANFFVMAWGFAFIFFMLFYTYLLYSDSKKR